MEYLSNSEIIISFSLRVLDLLQELSKGDFAIGIMEVVIIVDSSITEIGMAIRGLKELSSETSG